MREINLDSTMNPYPQRYMYKDTNTLRLEQFAGASIQCHMVEPNSIMVHIIVTLNWVLKQRYTWKI